MKTVLYCLDQQSVDDHDAVAVKDEGRKFSGRIRILLLRQQRTCPVAEFSEALQFHSAANCIPLRGRKAMILGHIRQDIPVDMPKISLEEEVQDPLTLETRMNTEKKSCNEDVRNEIPDFTQDEVQAAIDNLKEKVKQVTTTESGPKTSRHVTKRRNKRIRQIFIEVLKQEDCTPETWRKIRKKTQQTRPSAIRRPRRVLTFLLNAGPSCNIQTAGTEMPRVVYQNVGRDSGLHEGI